MAPSVQQMEVAIFLLLLHTSTVMAQDVLKDEKTVGVAGVTG